MRKYSLRKYNTKKYILDALKSMEPPEDIKVSEWAEAHRVLDEMSSHMPGYWRNSITPYLVGIMDEFNNYNTERIVFVKPTQVGGTEAMQNMLGFSIDEDPAPTLVVYPTETLAKTTSENRIQPMIRACESLSEKFHDKESSDLELQFDSMYISLTYSNSPSGLASKPIRYLFLDEVDKYPFASKREADPISLALERTKTFPNRKIFMTSTPTLRTGHIWRRKEECDCEKHYFVPCPHCKTKIELKFAQIKWPSKDSGLNNSDRAEMANYVCQECGCIITDANKNQMLQAGEWQVVKSKATNPRNVAFWINTLYSPFTRFSDIAKEFMDSKDDPDKLQNFTNSWLAEPWEDTKLKTNADIVLERQTELEAFVVPEWAKMLTGGVDVQENCLYYTIRAWGDHLTSQNIAHGQVFSFNEIETVMNLEYKKEDGTILIPDLVLVDSGDQTDEVYEFCAMHSDWALPAKGTGAMLSHYKLSTVNKSTSRAFGMNLVLVDGGKYKDMIAARMRRDNGQGAWMVYKGCDLEYAEQVTAEHKVVERSGGRERMVWVLKTSHADNHYLDTEVYAMAAADVLGVRTLFLQQSETKVEEPKKEIQTSEPVVNDNNWFQGEQVFNNWDY